MPTVPEEVRPPLQCPPLADHGEWARMRAFLVVTSRCWVFCGALGDDGYGRFWVPRPGREGSSACSSVRPSRWMWEAYNGPLRAGLVVRHHCDLTICARPECLADGTQSDNLQDAYRRDRITNGARLGRADKRGARSAAQTVRQAVLDAVREQITAPLELTQVVSQALVGGDPYKDQLTLW